MIATLDTSAETATKPSVSFATLRCDPPSKRLRDYYRNYGGKATFGSWLPFGNIGPVVMLASGDDCDTSEIKLTRSLFVAFQVTGADYNALQTYWLEEQAETHPSQVDKNPELAERLEKVPLTEPDFGEMEDIDVLRWLLEHCPMNFDEKEECYGEPGVTGLPDGVGKGMKAVVKALKCGLPPVDLSQIAVDLAIHNLISDAVREQHPALPFACDSECHYIAITHETYRHAIGNEVAANDSENMRSCRYFISPAEDIDMSSDARKLENRALLDIGAGNNDRLDDIRVNETVDMVIPESMLKLNIRGRDVEPEHVLKKILAQAAATDASDIHFEPVGSSGRIRIRVDGRLHTYMRPEDFKADLFNRIVLVAKDTASLSSTEIYKPDDSKFKFTYARHNFQIRASSIPLDGNVTKLVFRLQKKGAQLQTLEYLRFPEQTASAFRSIVQARQGMVLVTGPTGAGKTTTLYALLNEINRPDINIQTIEDPVEKTIPGINQAVLDEERGSDFDMLLRSIMRQDPDVILVGELRDAITVKTCIQAAQTGHMVFSTLHTNSAAEAFDRLAVQAADPFILARNITLVQAQRLVRCLCPHCRKETRITDGEREALAYFGVHAEQNATVYLPSSCKRCIGGFRGRQVVSEVVVVDDHIRDIICQGNKSDGTIATRIQKYCQEQGFQTYLQNAFHMALDGATSIAEALDYSTAIDRYHFDRILKKYRATNNRL